jgi:hypothetical protein
MKSLPGDLANFLVFWKLPAKNGMLFFWTFLLNQKYGEKPIIYGFNSFSNQRLLTILF